MFDDIVRDPDVRFVPCPGPLPGAEGFNKKVLVDAYSHGARVGRFLHKPMAPVDAAKVEFLTTLANLTGIRTPKAVAHELPVGFSVSCGVSIPFLDDYVPVPDFDLAQAAPQVLTYLCMTRWFNELVGNLHCWPGQLLAPADAVRRYSDIVMVDFDEAFCNVDPAFLHRALTETFHKPHVNLDQCRWLARAFRFEDALGWSPETYDSAFTVYGPLWRLFLCGRIELDLLTIRAQVSRAAATDPSDVRTAMLPFLEASAQYYRNPWVLLPAADNPKFASSEFERLFLERFARSGSEIAAFFEELTASREQPGSRMYRFYSRITERPY
jgi:hypothetical protein